MTRNVSPAALLYGRLGLLLELLRRRAVAMRALPAFSLRWISEVARPWVWWIRWEASGLRGSEVPCYGSRFALLEEAIRLAPADGDIFEFGVFSGKTINFLAQRTGAQVFGFDSFSGLPEDWVPGFPRGSFSMAGKTPEVEPNVRLVQGWFDESLPRFLKSAPPPRVALLHVDSDLYSSARVALSNLSRFLLPGCVLVFDEYAGLLPDDESRALRELLNGGRFESRFLGCSVDGSVAIVLTPSQ
jgi:hypothetical protein